MADDEEAPPTAQWFTDKEGSAPGPFNEEGLPHGQVRLRAHANVRTGALVERGR